MRNKKTNAIETIYIKPRSLVPGRICLAIIFLIFCGLYAFCIWSVPEKNQMPVINSSIASMVWIGALLLAIWFKKNWARYVLVGSLFLGVLTAVIAFLQMHEADIGVPPFLTVAAGVHFLMMVALMYLPPIRDLTRRMY